jgi:adenylate cyclase class IV
LRRIFRDVDRTGQKAWKILNYFSKVVEPKNALYIEPTKKYADIIIENKYIPFVEARDSKIKSTQIKYKIEGKDFEQIGQMINRMWGFYVGEVVETDYFLIARGEKIRDSDEIMRIRNVTFWKYLLSYRWPKAKFNEYEKRYGINFFIDHDTLQAFKKIYGEFRQVLRKKRQNYFLWGLVISLDIFENGDHYMDFRFEEWQEKKVLKDFLKEVWIKKSEWIKKSYFEIIH